MRVERLIHAMAATHGLPSQAGHRWCLVLGERGNQELAVRYGRTYQTRREAEAAADEERAIAAAAKA